MSDVVIVRDNALQMTHSQKQTITVDDVYRLSYGKRSSKRLGNRTIQHRLNLHERLQLEKARIEGLLWSTTAVNPAVLNTYFNFCEAIKRPFIILIKDKSDFLLTISFAVIKESLESGKFFEQSIQIKNALSHLFPGNDFTKSVRLERRLSEESAKDFLSTFRKALSSLLLKDQF